MTVNVYVPGGIPDIVVLVPEPVVLTSPGLRITVHVPVEGRLPSTTLPVATVHVGLVIVPGTGAVGAALTVMVKVAFAAAHGVPRGLSVVTVTTTFFPASAALGVYVNENGDAEAETGETVPAPFSVIVTFVALPPKVLPVTDTTTTPQVLPVEPFSFRVGLFVH